MLAFSLVIHYLTCITTERCIIITSQAPRAPNRKSNRVIVIITAYVVLLWLVIVLTDSCLFSSGSCTSKLWFLYKAQPDRDNYSPYKAHNTVALIIVTIWMTICNTVLNTTTIVTLRFIRTSIRDSERRLGVSAKRFETRRLIVVHVLSTFICALWIPYGIIVGQYKNIDPQIKQIIQIFFEALCYGGFFAVPLAVYIMDKRFWQFIKTTFNEILSVHPVNSQGQTQASAQVHVRSRRTESSEK